MDTPRQAIAAYQDQLVAVRHDLHAHPELGFQETRTAALLARELAALKLEVHSGLGGTGLVAVVHGRATASGRAVGLRADMDCLPITETTQVPHRSVHAGRMHACGHDGHCAMLLGAARYLSQTQRFNGTVYLIFQPAEEGLGGGQAMVKDGLFTQFAMEQVYALHNWPALAPGKIAVRSGPVMAAMDEFTVTLKGKGGHGAMPHLTVDPVVASAHVITALQTVASRNADPTEALVVSVTSMQTSQVGAYNVIPDHVKLLGTVRSFNTATRELAERRLREIVQGVASAMGAHAQLEYRHGYPATVNTPQEAAFAARVGAAVFGADNVITDANPSMGAEDFAYMLEQRPGAYVWLGQGSGANGCFLHNPGYDFNDDVIPLGAGYLAALVEAALPIE